MCVYCRACFAGYLLRDCGPCLPMSAYCSLVNLASLVMKISSLIGAHNSKTEIGLSMPKALRRAKGRTRLPSTIYASSRHIELSTAYWQHQILVE
jgi:hypothetical protein